MKRRLLALAAVVALALPAAALADGHGHGDGNGHGHGNSWAAHACRHGGFHSLVGADGRTFRNVGACVRFAAHGGAFANPSAANASVSANGFVIPAGAVATISGAHWNLGPCDALSYGYQLDTGTAVTLGSKAPGCANGDLPGATVGPFPNETVLRIFLTDTGNSTISCNDTFYSNGSHALVSGGNPWQVAIRDSSACAVGTGAPLAPAGPGQGNLDVTVTVTGGQVAAFRHGDKEHGRDQQKAGDDGSGD